MWNLTILTQKKNQFNANYKKSPFYSKAYRMHLNIIKKDATKGEKNPFYNEKFCKLLLNKYAAYAPLWTNIMGVFVETKDNTRISNSPVESYFNIVKNITMEGQRYVRPSKYIRESYIYAQAKCNEVEMRYLEENKVQPNRKRKINSVEVKKAKRQRKTLLDKEDSGKQIQQRIHLEEDVWKRTPKKCKSKISDKILYEKILKRHSRLPRALKDKRYVLFKYQSIFQKLGLESYSTEVDLVEFNSLNPKREIYNNVLEIFVYIQIV